MAELTGPLPVHTGAALALAQFRAVLRLRWLVFRNGFRRKGGWADLAGRLLLLPLITALVLLPSVVAGVAAWYLAGEGAPQFFSALFWAVFFLAQLLNINLGQPGTAFDPLGLIRFPLTVRGFVLIRLCFGVLSPANVLAVLMSGAIFLGVVLARPSAWLGTLIITTAFALANVLFSRMAFAWVDRWLARRRSREVFTALVFAATLGFQYLNVTYNPGFGPIRHRGAAVALPPSLHGMLLRFGSLGPRFRWTPPSLAGSALGAATAANGSTFWRETVLILLYAATFLAIYTWRMRKEYRGENLSDTAHAVATAHLAPSASRAAVAARASFHTLPDEASWRTRIAPHVLSPVFRKEVLLLRRNVGLLYGVIAPAVMVFLFAGRMSLHGSSPWLMQAAVAYALLGIAPLSYNAFGMEGEGAQLYFIAPVRLRDVFLAKNLMQLGLAIFEVLSIIVILGFVARRPSPHAVSFSLLWAAATLLLNTAVGNLRSIAAPKKVAPGKPMNRAQSQLSVWMSLGILGGCAVLGAAFQLAAHVTQRPWLDLVLVTVFAGTGMLVYVTGLQQLDAFALARRGGLFEELGKKT